MKLEYIQSLLLPKHTFYFIAFYLCAFPLITYIGARLFVRVLESVYKISTKMLIPNCNIL